MQFFLRSKTTHYFLDLSIEGADTLGNVYNLYTGSHQYPNLFQYFKHKRDIKRRNPVLILFDNEQNGKPLKKCLNSAKQKMPPNDFSLHVVGNLFYLAIPLVKGKSECAIEDLFQDELLTYKIGGRSFHSNDDQKLSKDDFSQYVITHYESIDFSNFVPLLEKMVQIIKDSYK